MEKVNLRHQILFPAATLLFLTGMGMFVLEIACRILDLGSTPPSSDSEIFQSHIEIGCALKPVWTGIFADQWVEINSVGRRGPDLSSKQPDEKRVAIVGDSFAFGWGVSEKETVAARLEQIWKEVAPATRILSVVNAGVPGYNLIQDASWCLTEGLDPDLGLDLAIILVVPNDLEDPILFPPLTGEDARREIKWHNQVREDPRNLVLPGRETFRLVNLLNRFLLNTLPPQLELRRAFLDYYSIDLFRTENWRKTQESLLRLKSAYNQPPPEFELVFYPIPYRLEDHPFEGFHKTISEWCQIEGIPIRDPWSQWTVYSDEDLALHPEDMHPNARCHGLMAEYLLETVIFPRYLTKEKVP